jgi:hypothetical protein
LKYFCFFVGEILNADFNMSRDTCDVDMDPDERNLEQLLSPEESLDLQFEDDGRIHQRPQRETAPNLLHTIANNFHTPLLPPHIRIYNSRNNSNYNATTMNPSNNTYNYDQRSKDISCNGSNKRVGIQSSHISKTRTPLSPEILSSNINE